METIETLEAWLKPAPAPSQEEVFRKKVQLSAAYLQEFFKGQGEFFEDYTEPSDTQGFIKIRTDSENVATELRNSIIEWADILGVGPFWGNGTISIEIVSIDSIAHYKIDLFLKKLREEYQKDGGHSLMVKATERLKRMAN